MRKNFLRKLAVGTLLLMSGSALAVTPTVTQNWITKGLPGGAKVVRSGSGVNGKCYLPADKDLYIMDASGYTKVLTTTTMNKGLAIDDAGNIIVASFPTGTSNWNQVRIISADFQTVKNLTLKVPTGSSWVGNRYDVVGNAIGNFMSAEGGLFYITSTSANNPIPIWIKNGEQYVTAGSTTAAFTTANSTASAVPSVSSMADVTDSNVKNLFYYRTGGNSSQIGYVGSDGKAAYLKTPTGMPSGWTERSQNGFAVFHIDGELYQVRMAGPAIWCNSWVLTDASGKTVYSQSYIGTNYAPTGVTGDGCNIIARQINPYKVELYQIYTTSTAAAGFCAMYTIEVPHIVLDKSDMVLNIGESATLTASLGLQSMTDKSVTWTSSNPEIATVDAQGRVTGIASGAATITATSNGNGLKATCKVEVNPVAVTKVTLNNTELALLFKETATLTATVAPDDATYKTVTWSSDNTAVATVTDAGVVTAVGVGSANITATAHNGVSAACAVNVSLKPLYMAGDFQGWNPENALEIPEVNGKYSYTFPDKAQNGFKISTVKGGWDAFNSGVLGASDDNVQYVLAIDETVQLQAGKLGNLAAPGEGNWTITIDPETYKLTFTGSYPPIENLYAVGSFQNWNLASAYQFTDKGNGIYTLSLYEVEGQFKLSTSNNGQWDGDDSFNAGVLGVAEDNTTFTLTPDQTIKLDEGKKGNFAFPSNDNWTLTYNSNRMTLTLEKTVIERAPFAYDLTNEPIPAKGYTIKFKSTGYAPNAVLVLTKVGETNWTKTRALAESSEAVTKEINMGKVNKGENSFELIGSDLPDDGQYTWSVRIESYSIPKTAISKPVSVGGGRAGLVVFTDPEYPEVFGKVVIGRTQNGGLDIYAPDGSLESSAVHKNCALLGGANAGNFSPMDGKQRGTEAIMASWNTTAYGVVAFDIADLDAEPYSVFEGVKNSSGVVMNGNVKVGSGTTCVAFSGSGENTRMYTFDKQIFANHLAYSKIGTANTVGTALVDLAHSNTLANQNVAMWGTENGVFLTQIRAAGMGPTPGLAYFDNAKGAVTWKVADMASVDANFLPSASAGVCINPAGNLIAVATYTGMEVYNLSWNGELPVLSKYMTVASPYSSGIRTNIQFDAANNLHVVHQNNGYYTVALANENPVAETPARTIYNMDIATGVSNIAVDEEPNATPVYYNLNGVRVKADNLTPGIYVKVTGKTATKVVVK